MVNFNIIENSPSQWDKIDEVARLYNQGLPVKEIRERLDLGQAIYHKMLRVLVDEGKVIPRGKNYRPSKVKKPKNYYRHSVRGGFNISYYGEYYGYVKTEEQAKEFVRLMRECNWDKSKKAEVKRRVVNGD